MEFISKQIFIDVIKWLYCFVSDFTLKIMVNVGEQCRLAMLGILAM